MNCSRNSISAPVSFSREKPMSKEPEVFGPKCDASTDTVALQIRCGVGGCIGENCTSLTARTGLQSCSAAAGIVPARPMRPASNEAKQDRANSRPFAQQGSAPRCAGITNQTDIGISNAAADQKTCGSYGIARSPRPG